MSKSFCIIAVLMVLLTSIYESEAYTTKDGILELSKESFKLALKHHPFLCVCFHAKNSRMSQKFKQTYIDIKNQMKKINKNVTFASIELGEHGEIEKHYLVLEIPMIKLFKKERHYDFQGEKTVNHVLVWLELALNVPVVVSSHQELDDLKKRGSVILGCFPGNKPIKGYKVFHEVSSKYVSAKHIPLPRFALITKASVSRDVGLLAGSVHVYKHFEYGEKVTYKGDLSNEVDMLKFCEEESQPIVFPYGNEELSMKINSATIKYNHLLFMPKSDHRFAQTYKNFKEAAKVLMKGKDDLDVLFIYVDTALKHLEKVVGFFHVDLKKDVPCNRMTMLDHYHSRFMPDNKDFTKEGFIHFTKAVMAGKVHRTIKTQPLPSDWDKYPVKTIVGSNYLQFTREKGKIVLMMYYVTGQKESEAILPMIDELALQYKLNKTVKIGVMNVQNNDGEIDVHFGYPNFKLFTADNKEILYRGHKSYDAVKKFLDTNGKIQLGAIEEEHPDGSNHDFAEYIERMHGKELDYEAEEDRKTRWSLEDHEMIENAIHREEADEPEEHHAGIAHGETTDHKEMDPKIHANPEAHQHIEHIHDTHHHFEHVHDSHHHPYKDL